MREGSAANFPKKSQLSIFGILVTASPDFHIISIFHPKTRNTTDTINSFGFNKKEILFPFRANGI